MSDLVTLIIGYSIYAATLAFLFAILFVYDFRRWSLRLATAAVGIAAVLAPAFLATRTLGYPTPWPPAGRYDLIGWEVSEADKVIYLFVAGAGDPVPRHFQVPFVFEDAVTLQQAQNAFGTFKTMAVDIVDGLDGGPPRYTLIFEKVFPDPPADPPPAAVGAGQ